MRAHPSGETAEEDFFDMANLAPEDTGLPMLLQEASPSLAVISVGDDNTYGHPVPRVLADLSAKHVETLRTDQHGTVSILLGASGGDGFRVETGE